jgi:hypothetical protein
MTDTLRPYAEHVRLTAIRIIEHWEKWGDISDEDRATLAALLPEIDDARLAEAAEVTLETTP